MTAAFTCLLLLFVQRPDALRRSPAAGRTVSCASRCCGVQHSRTGGSCDHAHTFSLPPGQIVSTASCFLSVSHDPTWQADTPCSHGAMPKHWLALGQIDARFFLTSTKLYHRVPN